MSMRYPIYPGMDAPHKRVDLIDLHARPSYTCASSANRSVPLKPGIQHMPEKGVPYKKSNRLSRAPKSCIIRTRKQRTSPISLRFTGSSYRGNLATRLRSINALGRSRCKHAWNARPLARDQVSSFTIFFFLSGTVSTAPGLLCLMRLSTCGARHGGIASVLAHTSKGPAILDSTHSCRGENSE